MKHYFHSILLFAACAAMMSPLCTTEPPAKKIKVASLDEELAQAALRQQALTQNMQQQLEAFAHSYLKTYTRNEWPELAGAIQAYLDTHLQEKWPALRGDVPAPTLFAARKLRKLRGELAGLIAQKLALPEVTTLLKEASEAASAEERNKLLNSAREAVEKMLRFTISSRVILAHSEIEDDVEADEKLTALAAKHGWLG